jgi:lipid-A-disaccharide synthase
MSGPLVYLSAGEPSGDRLGARVAAAIRTLAPDAEIEGMGGPRMSAAGVRILQDAGALAANGLVESAHRLPAHLRLLRDVGRRFRRRRHSLAILVDYAGFHLAAARVARAAGLPVLHYVAPQLWAWGGWRAARLRARVDRLAVILPFEETFFRARGIDARFVGHPLLDEPPPVRSQARSALGIDAHARVLALFPGSRSAEVRRLWPVFREAGRVAGQGIPDLTVAVAAMPGFDYPGFPPEMVRCESAALLAAAADAALCKAGTASLEAALAGLPHVVAYRTHPVTWAAARRLVEVPWVSLVNLVAESGLVPELLQGAATPARLARALGPLLADDPAAGERQRQGFREVRARLGTPGAALRVARMALELVA